MIKNIAISNHPKKNVTWKEKISDCALRYIVEKPDVY